jgi:hypothetical protein
MRGRMFRRAADRSFQGEEILPSKFEREKTEIKERTGILNELDRA